MVQAVCASSCLESAAEYQWLGSLALVMLATVHPSTMAWPQEVTDRLLAYVLARAGIVDTFSMETPSKLVSAVFHACVACVPSLRTSLFGSFDTECVCEGASRGNHAINPITVSAPVRGVSSVAGLVPDALQKARVRCMPQPGATTSAARRACRGCFTGWSKGGGQACSC